MTIWRLWHFSFLLSLSAKLNNHLDTIRELYGEEKELVLVILEKPLKKSFAEFYFQSALLCFDGDAGV